MFASSASVYGNSKNIPIKECENRKPIGTYAKTKFECEILAEEFSKKNTSVVGLRYFNVFGHKHTSGYSGIISNIVDKINRNEELTIYGDGLQSRDFIHVLDVVKANVAAMITKKKHHVFTMYDLDNQYPYWI